MQRRELVARFWNPGLFCTIVLLYALATPSGYAQPRLVAWGDFSAGTNVPTGISDIRAIATGPSYGLLLRSNGTVMAWGNNTAGQTNLPGGLNNIKAVAAGEYHCLALRSNG